MVYACEFETHSGGMVTTSFCNKGGICESCHLYLLFHDLDDSGDRTCVKLANSQNRHPSSERTVGFPWWVTLNAKTESESSETR